MAPTKETEPDKVIVKEEEDKDRLFMPILERDDAPQKVQPGQTKKKQSLFAQKRAAKIEQPKI